MTMKTLFLTLLILGASVAPASAKTEFGKLQNAEYRIDVPANWNHGLVLYCHGYDPHPMGVGYDEKKPLPPELAVFVKLGYALAQTGYSTGGWAVEQAIPDIEALRKHFIQAYGQPKETFITGHSMGGLLTVVMIETNPQAYDAGLDFCGAVESTPRLLTRGFDARILFDYYFPGVLPNPARVPKDYQLTEQLSKTVFDRVQTKPQSAGAIRKLLAVHNNKDLTGTLILVTYILKEIEQRAGGNPFDNRGTIYSGSADDKALNDGVKRYAADSGALAYL
jgi:pimeloyl-ACP methyl ester carboxylesterase